MADVENQSLSAGTQINGVLLVKSRTILTSVSQSYSSIYKRSCALLCTSNLYLVVPEPCTDAKPFLLAFWITHRAFWIGSATHRRHCLLCWVQAITEDPLGSILKASQRVSPKCPAQQQSL